MTGVLRDGLAELSEEVHVVDLRERVLRGSRRITVRNWVVASVAAIAAMSGTAWAVAAVRPAPTPPPPNPSATPSGPPAVVDIRDAMFEVPAFPGAEEWCPAALRWFGEGYVRTGGRAETEISMRMIGEPVRGDIDGVPGDEILVEMRCSKYDGLSRGQVLAVKVLPDGKYTSMGFVLRSPDHASFVVHAGHVRVERGTVLVDLLSPDHDGPVPTLDLQTRGYAYRDGGFVQVSGPTRFADPPGDYRRVDFRNVTTCVKISHFRYGDVYGYTRISDGKGTVTLDGVRYEISVLSSAAFFSKRPFGAVLYRLQPQFGSPITVINIYLMYKPIPCGYDVIMLTDVDGATKIEAHGAELRVTIDGRVKTYREDPPGSVLTWVSSA